MSIVLAIFPLKYGFIIVQVYLYTTNVGVDNTNIIIILSSS